MSHGFKRFLKKREAISNEYINGDAGSFDKIVTRKSPSTFMPPSGAVVTGARKVAKAHREGANGFRKGSEGRFDIHQSGSDGELAYWSGLQPAKVMLADKDEPVPMTLRVTEVFRFEDGGWKIVHRHADMLKDD